MSRRPGEEKPIFTENDHHFEAAKEKCENHELDGDLDKQPVESQLKTISGNIKELGKDKSLNENDHEMLKYIEKGLKYWTETLNPENSEETRKTYQALPENQRDVIYGLYKTEIRDFLTLTSRFTEKEEANSAVINVMARMLDSKISPGSVNTEQIGAQFGNILSEPQIAKVIDLSNRMKDLGPSPFYDFVSTHFGEVNLKDGEIDNNVREIADNLAREKTNVYKDLVALIDEQSPEIDPKTERPSWEHYDVAHSSWEELGKLAETTKPINAANANRYKEKTWYGTERVHETKHGMYLFNATQYRQGEGDDPYFHKEKVMIADITIYTEHLMFEDISIAQQYNPWEKRKVFSARYNNLEKCYEGLEQLDAAVPLDLTGKEIKKPIKWSDASTNWKNVDGNGQEIKNDINFAVTIIEDDTPKRLIVSYQTYMEWKNKVAYAKSVFEQHGFKYDPTQSERKKSYATDELTEDGAPNKKEVHNYVEGQGDIVDQLRQMNAIEKIGQEHFKKLTLQNGGENEQTAEAQIGAKNGVDIYKAFTERFGRLSEYRRIAEDRARKSGLVEDTYEWYTFTESEMNNVEIEMDYLESTLKHLASEIFDLSNTPGAEAEADLQRLLGSLDSEIYRRLIARIASSRLGLPSYDALNSRIKSLIEPYLKRVKHNNSLAVVEVPFPTDLGVKKMIEEYEKLNAGDLEDQRVADAYFERIFTKMQHSTETPLLEAGEDIASKLSNNNVAGEVWEGEEIPKQHLNRIDMTTTLIPDASENKQSPYQGEKVVIPTGHRESVLGNIMSTLSSLGPEKLGGNTIKTINSVLQQMGETPLSEAELAIFNIKQGESGLEAQPQVKDSVKGMIGTIGLSAAQQVNTVQTPVTTLAPDNEVETTQNPENLSEADVEALINKQQRQQGTKRFRGKNTPLYDEDGGDIDEIGPKRKKTGSKNGRRPKQSGRRSQKGYPDDEDGEE